MAQEIVARVQMAKGNMAAADDLIRDYLPFIRSETSKALGRIPVVGQDDEVSIAMIAFHESIESYSSAKGSFLSYASVNIRRRLIDYHRKEKRHAGLPSLDTPIAGNEDFTTRDIVKDSSDAYQDMDLRDATKQEIEELVAQLHTFGLTLTDISENCPKQARTLQACQRALQYAKENPALIDELKISKKLPMTKLAAGSGVERKTLERHRKYILVLLLIYSNGYEMIRGHLKQVLRKGGHQQ